MTEKNNDSAGGASTFVQSALFARTFREGMALVEETANYLDGEGRDAAKDLERENALSYASASMRLTTQLMQIASWLLVIRAVREGEMGLAEAGDKQYRIDRPVEALSKPDLTGLPVRLVGLIEAAHQLYSRINRLDKDLFDARLESGFDNDAVAQQQALMRAFGQHR